MEAAAIDSANAAVQSLLTHRVHGNAAAAAAALPPAQTSLSTLFLALRALRHLPHADSLQPSEEQASRFSLLLSTNCTQLQGGGSVPAPSPAPERARAPVPAAAAAEDRGLAGKRALRNQLAAQLAQLGAAAGTIARDAEVLDATGRAHAELREDAALSGKLVRAWQAKERSDIRWVQAAAYLLILTAAYLCLRRVCWLFGLRI